MVEKWYEWSNTQCTRAAGSLTKKKRITSIFSSSKILKKKPLRIIILANTYLTRNNLNIFYNFTIRKYVQYTNTIVKKILNSQVPITQNHSTIKAYFIIGQWLFVTCLECA